jgi:hypothetical protein
MTNSASEARAGRAPWDCGGSCIADVKEEGIPFREAAEAASLDKSPECGFRGTAALLQAENAQMGASVSEWGKINIAKPRGMD